VSARKKVCLLAVLHEPFDKRVFQKVARSLVGAGYDVVSVCPCLEPGTTPREAEGVRFHFLPMPQSKRQRLRTLLQLVRVGLRERADIYCAPEPESWVAALLVKALRGGKVVFDMHEHAPSEFAKFFPAPLRPLVEWTTVRFMRLFARFTDHIILTRGSFDAPWAGLRTPRSVVINTNHLQPPCTAVPEALRARFAGHPTIIHQGLFGDVRGSLHLLEAVKILVRDLPDLRCIVLGRYVYGSEADYRRAISEAGLDDNLLLLGEVPYDAVPAHIAVAQVGLILFQPGLLNHTLAMPHKLFDYMREGVPVVVPDFAVEVARIVREADCGHLVDVTRPEAIAGAIRALLEDPERARQLGAQGRRLIEDKYHWEADEARLLAAFRGL
jgi:glycosyltransferase involved in cell wall biosynthesis